MSFWAKFFGKKKKKEKSKYLPENEIPNDLSFVKKFTIKGGRFLFCENNNETSFNFNEILVENNWNLNDVFCFDNDIKKKIECRCFKR